MKALERIYDKYGRSVLDSTIRLAIATWEGEKNSLSANILSGIARILVTYNDSINEDTFKDKVGQVSVKQIIRTAKERGHGHIGYAEAMMLEYNSKNKHRLSIRQRPYYSFLKNKEVICKMICPHMGKRPYYSFLKNKEVICKMICPHMGTEVEIKTRRNICDVLLLTFIAAKGMI